MTSAKDSQAIAVCIAESSQFVSVAHTDGFSIFSIDPFKLIDRCSIHGAHAIAINSDATKIAIAMKLIERDSTIDQVSLWNANSPHLHPDASISFSEPVIRLCIRGSLLLVILRTGICLLDLTRFEPLMEQATAPNSTGCSDIATGNGPAKLALCDLIPGKVHILPFDADARAVFIQAHSHALSVIKFSGDGSLVATASEYGTLIRVFFSDGGGLRSVFRRGSLRSRVVAMAISPKLQKLVAVSENGTVHAFSLAHRVNTFGCAPRASSKVIVAKAKIYDLAFVNEDKLFIAGSNGSCYFMKFEEMVLSIVRESAMGDSTNPVAETEVGEAPLLGKTEPESDCGYG
jgi:WD40 repeat protein